MTDAQPSERGVTDENQPAAPTADAAAALQQPHLWRRKSQVLDQAYDEYCERLEAGEAVDPDAFCARFPGFETSLRRQIEAHEYLEKNPHLLAGLPSPGNFEVG